MREQRPVSTAQSSFAAAELPSGDDEALVVPEMGHMSPHEILGVARDADADAIQDAYIEKMHDAHPDQNGSVEEFKRVQKAKQALLDERDR